MSAATLSLLALLVAIVLSMASRLNVGLMALALAWLIGVFGAGLSAEAVIRGYPVSLFLTITGVTLLFACVESNGALRVLASRAVLVAGGRRWALPILFFLIAAVVSMVGPGSISSVALVVPLAMAIGLRAGVPTFLVALAVTNGANAGNLSPVSAVGVVANNRMAEAGLIGHEWRVFAANFLAHLLVTAVAFLLFGGLRLHGRAESQPGAESHQDSPPFERGHLLSLAIVAAWIVGVVGFRLPLGLSAFAAVALILVLRTASQERSIAQVPWNVVLMVTGVATLIALMEKTGGLTLFTSLLARLATPGTVNGVMAFVTGAISTYSSTSGVVLPAFLPTVPQLVQQLGGGDPLAIALSINVGSALVDVSPLSTLGAMCVAAVQDPDESQRLFHRLFAWGLSMVVAGAVICQLFAPAFARI
ncbi:MAG: SLC13 family permease [Blastocatellia bacterium]|jgi:Na+/H+ antiporter NhaD/arsenite permease-like protein